MTSFTSYFSSASSRERLAYEVSKHCLLDEKGRAVIVELLSLHFDITMTEAGRRWVEFMKGHERAAEEYRQTLPSAASITPIRAASLLAYLDPRLEKIMPSGWKIWDDPAGDETKQPKRSLLVKRKRESDSEQKTPPKKVQFAPQVAIHNIPGKPRERRPTRRASPFEKKEARDTAALLRESIFLFRTGITDSIRWPGLELCAVCHQYGRFTVVWMKCPGNGVLPEELRQSAARIKEWKEAGTDPLTGLARLDAGGEGGWGKELSVFVDFLTRQFYFNVKGFILCKNQSVRCPEYENTLFKT